MTEARLFYPIVLCFHGVAASPEDADELHVTLDDFKQLIRHLLSLGYKFVAPSVLYSRVLEQSWPEPLAAIHFDDGLVSIAPAADWLIQEHILFGIAVISSRLGETGYLSLSQLHEYEASGLTEMLYHTHDSHHYGLAKNGEGQLVSCPLLEHPAWFDDGQLLYGNQHEESPYNLSHLKGAYSFPIFGTDPESGRLISSAISFKATANATIKTIRFWSCSDAEAELEVHILYKERILFEGSISDWVCGEFFSIELNRPLQLQTGESVTLHFKTRRGNGRFNVYAPSRPRREIRISTTSTGADFPADRPWPAVLGLILATGTGRSATDEEFSQLVANDIQHWQQAVSPRKPVSQAVYPFGAYYAAGQAVHPALVKVLKQRGITGGWSYYPARLAPGGTLREPGLRHDPYALPRFPVSGSWPLPETFRHIDLLIGNVYKPITGKSDLIWQTSAEYDAAGNATVRYSAFDHIAWDAFYFRENGEIEEGEINKNDLNESRNAGRSNVLIFSNYDFKIGMPNGDLAWEVLHWPEQYLEKIESIVLEGDWNGAYLNLEWVFPSDRELLNRFVKKLAKRMRRHGKLLHLTVPAITGTDYDLPEWTAAFDYAELIRHVDVMKIMTYTEAVDDEAPQPHAPDTFFQAVYDYADQVIPKKYRQKILVGVNTFGRIWTSDGESSWGRYASYHECLAEAVRLGAHVQHTVNGEGYWQSISEEQTITCYFGTPDTVWRAVQLAAARGYMGVGLWKADDGDLFEHFPRK